MSEKVWNFHSIIACPLEKQARDCFMKYCRPMGKIYDADAIESGCFAEVMIYLLREKTGFDNNCEINDFAKEVAKYIGVGASLIEEEVAKKLYNRFKELMR